MMQKRPFILGISGGSGSGKTTLARTLASHFGPTRARLLAQDSYYIDQSHRFDGDGGSVNFDHPSAIEFALMARHLSALKSAQPIEVPIYDFATHKRRGETEPFPPVEFVIAEGILLLSQPVICAELDFSVFVDAHETVRFARRLKRDTTERGRTAEGVKKQFELQVKPMHDEFVEPSRGRASLVVSGESPLMQELELVLRRLPAR